MISDQLWLGLYRLACHLLTTMPNFDTLEGEERRQAVLLKASLVQFIRVTEDKYRLPHTIQTKAERRHKQLA